ncbi:UDP-N-acetyl-D-glucosamine 2-epimerase, UDP-hydrolysing [Lewinella sp. 4G2]|nr:UDP-N-acetyl-D-glucosamine 2-epimerase, UDP-hydrolysing [Lewinella sp. 4G2]
MTVRLITTSRADYGIYASLLTALEADPAIDLQLVVAGTHLSKEHGYTVTAIELDGYQIAGRVETVPSDDSPAGIARMLGEATRKFADLWAEIADNTDWVIALGDRYEMFAAVAATVPFNLRVAHLHGGETSLGAIDDKFRHAITVMSTAHFTATAAYADRVTELIGSERSVHYVGAPALDGLEEMELFEPQEMLPTFGTDFSEPPILVTFHPETVATKRNQVYGEALCSALARLSGQYPVVITMPNADTMGSVLRQQFNNLADDNDRITTIENFGKKGYFSAMKHCAFLLGNTSSGIIEAASFGKYAINLGNRQDGRMRSPNLIDVEVDEQAILSAVDILRTKGFLYAGDNVYRKDSPAAAAIVAALKAAND